MRLTSGDGSVMDLRPLRYQFGPSPEPRDWDANWLVVQGHIELRDGRTWSFTDPCLTTWEARELGSWLRAVRLGHVLPAAFDGEMDEPALAFTEPNVAFSLTDRCTGSATVRIHLSVESLPPWLQDAGGLFEFFVEVQLTHAALANAEAAWEQELAAFPIR